MIPKMILEPRLNLDTKLSFEPMILMKHQNHTPRASLQSVENEIKRIQRHVGGLSRLLTSGARKRGHAKGEEILQKIYSRHRKMILQPRLNLHAKLSFEPMSCRPYQACTPRTSLQSVENERGKDK